MSNRYDGSITINTNIDNKGFDNGISKLTKSANRLGKAVIAAFSVKVVADFVKESVNAASELSNAYTGLESILNGQGRSFQKAKGFIQDYIQDGLLSATEAVTTYKNLSLRGYSDDQIKSVMLALKDSATFGRQSSYTLGQAVMTASEGLKNENSILVDNAGVTKNVAKMWDEYAKSIGTTSNKLTQQQKIQAEVNGILEETKFQAGDAELYLNTYSGQLSRVRASFTVLKQTVGNTFIPIFQAILPWINAIVTGLTQVAQVFASVVNLIFGKTASTNKKVATNSNTAAKGISNLGNAAEKAGNQAKGALASFDKLEVIDSPDSSSASGGGGSSGTDTGVDFSGLIDGTGELNIVSAEIEAIAKSIMSFFEPLKDISFDNLVNSLKGVLEAAKPITKTIWEGLYWAWVNILVPLAKWTIEDLLPAFLDLLSGALKVLNPVIKAFMSVSMWLWDNFLKPIAKWTGGVIISVLKALANALKKIGDWMSKNQKVVNAFTAIILAFFAAWKLTELMAFIQMSGGLIKVLGNIANAVKGCTVAKLADKAETMYLTALYAKDFIVSLGKTVIELAKNTAAWIANTAAQLAAKVSTMSFNPLILAQAAATKVAEAAQWLWNAALSANPITLVVIAVTALIAAITALVIWTNQETEEEKKLAEETKKHAEESKKLVEEYEKLQQQKQEKIQSDIAEINNTQRLSEELKGLVDENGNVLAGNEARVKFILEQLNSAMGTEYQLVNNQIQGYSDLSTTIDKNIEKKKAQILLEAEEATYKEALIKKTETEMERAKAKLAMDEALLKFNEEQNAKNGQIYLDAVKRFNNLDKLSDQYNADIQRYENASMAVLEGNNDKAIDLLADKNAAFKTSSSVIKESSDKQQQILGDQYAESLTALESYTEKYRIGLEGYTEEGLKEAQRYAENAKKEYEKVGGHIVDGTIEGVNGKKHNLNSTINKLYSMVPDWAKNVLGIHSPSKVFEEIAEYTDEGYIKGIEGGRKGVLGSIEQLMSLVTGAAKNTQDIFDVNPVGRLENAIVRLNNVFRELETITSNISDNLKNIFNTSNNIRLSGFNNIPIPKLASGTMQPYANISNNYNTQTISISDIKKAFKEALQETKTKDRSYKAIVLEPIGKSEFARFTIKAINNEHEAAGKTLLKI